MSKFLKYFLIASLAAVIAGGLMYGYIVKNIEVEEPTLGTFGPVALWKLVSGYLTPLNSAWGVDVGDNLLAKNASITDDLTVGDTLWGTTGSPLNIGSQVSTSDDLTVGDDIYANDGYFDYVNFAFLISNFVGGIDATGDPWYLSGTDFQVAENLLVDKNASITADLTVSDDLYIDDDANLSVFTSNISSSNDITITDTLWASVDDNMLVVGSSTKADDRNSTGGYVNYNTYNFLVHGSTTDADIMMYYDVNKGALMGGSRYLGDWKDSNIGELSFAWGEGAHGGDGVVAFGRRANGTTTDKYGGFVAGYEANIVGGTSYPIAIGYKSEASGSSGPIAIGNQCDATGTNSIAIGTAAQATGYRSVAIGYQSEAIDIGTLAAGYQSEANDDYATALGRSVIVEGRQSLGIGYEVNVGAGSGDYGATAIGYYVDALENHSVAIGLYASSTGDGSIVLGSGVADDDPLVNSTANSLAIGLASTTATLTVQDYYVSSTGETSFSEDVWIGGTLYGGSPLDIGSAMSSTEEIESTGYFSNGNEGYNGSIVEMTNCVIDGGLVISCGLGGTGQQIYTEPEVKKFNHYPIIYGWLGLLTAAYLILLTNKLWKKQN